MNLVKLVGVLLAGAALALGVVACGDDDGGGDTNGGQSTQEATPTPAPATSPASGGNDTTPPPGENEVNVTTRNFAFDPAEITVPAGEPITFNFANEDSAPHTFTLYLDEDYTQAIPDGSASEDTPEITVSFVDPGKYYFRCEIHPSQMQGELTAE